MLYPDSKRRISELVKISDLFKQRGYLRTAKEVTVFINILKGKKIPNDFLKKLESIFDIFHVEFEKKVIVGQTYRKDVFREISDTTLNAISRLKTDYPKTLMTIFPLFQRLNKGQKITGQIGEELTHKTIKDKNVIFHLHCYTYLIIIEGIYDELTRILYFLNVASPNFIPSLADLKLMSVYEIQRKLGTKPVFLKKLADKKHIRNAIGHATTYYDSKNDVVQFINIHPKTGAKWDSGLIPLQEFHKMALELEDTISAFLYIFVLLKIYDFIASNNPFQ